MQLLRSLAKLKHDDFNHKEIDKIAGELHPSDPDFPWDSLRKHTDRCIKNQKDITIPEGLDMLLISLIQRHPHPTKAIVVAACAHALSTEATITLLNGPFIYESTDFEALPIFIQILLAIHHANPTVINNSEANLARV
jgi:hypothetical protein